MYHIVVNPNGACGQTAKQWKKVEKYLIKNKIEYKAYFSSLECDIDDLCQMIVEENNMPNLILIGGDGSLNKAINGIGNLDAVRIGLIPSGSGNDFAKSVGLSLNPIRNLEGILSNDTTTSLDIGVVKFHNMFDESGNLVKGEMCRKFNVSCGFGFDAEICHGTLTSSWKNILNKLHMGKLIYLFVALRMLRKLHLSDCEVLVNGEQIDCERLLFAAIMNEPYEGGGFKFCPKAKPNDNQIDVCVGGNLNFASVCRVFPFAYFGHHDGFKDVHIHQGSTLDVRVSEPLWVQTDGEVEYMSTHLSTTLSNQKLHVLNKMKRM